MFVIRQISLRRGTKKILLLMIPKRTILLYIQARYYLNMIRIEALLTKFKAIKWKNCFTQKPISKKWTIARSGLSHAKGRSAIFPKWKWLNTDSHQSGLSLWKQDRKGRLIRHRKNKLWLLFLRLQNWKIHGSSVYSNQNS